MNCKKCGRKLVPGFTSDYLKCECEEENNLYFPEGKPEFLPIESSSLKEIVDNSMTSLNFIAFDGDVLSQDGTLGDTVVSKDGMFTFDGDTWVKMVCLEDDGSVCEESI